MEAVGEGGEFGKLTQGDAALDEKEREVKSFILESSLYQKQNKRFISIEEYRDYLLSLGNQKLNLKSKVILKNRKEEL